MINECNKSNDKCESMFLEKVTQKKHNTQKPSKDFLFIYVLMNTWSNSYLINEISRYIQWLTYSEKNFTHVQPCIVLT